MDKTDNTTKKIEEMERQVDEWLAKREAISNSVLEVLKCYDIDTGEAASILDHVAMALKNHADIKGVRIPHKEVCPF